MKIDEGKMTKRGIWKFCTLNSKIKILFFLSIYFSFFSTKQLHFMNSQVNNSFLIWSYCDASHWDINNIQIPLTSTGNELLIQYYSAKGSHNGQEFTYAISYRFIRKERNSIVAKHKYKSISLRPVNLSALNLNDIDSYDCDSRIGTFKNWFAVLAVFGIVSFIGAVVTIVVLTIKCLRIGSSDKKLLQNGKQWGRTYRGVLRFLNGNWKRLKILESCSYNYNNELASCRNR